MLRSIILAALMAMASFTSALAAIFTPVDVPGARETTPQDINDLGVVVGFYSLDGSAPREGFRFDGTTYTAIVHPLATAGTYVAGVNNAGVVVGQYNTAPAMPGGSERSHGFIWQDGVFTDFDAPGGFKGTAFTDINDAGDIIGYFGDGGETLTQGFVLSGGIFTTVRDGTAQGTILKGINNLGQIVGYSDFGAFIYSGGVFDHVLGARTPLGINDAGTVVGIEFSTAGGSGFVYASNGAFGLLNHPDGTNGTFLEGINNVNGVTGTYSVAGEPRGRGFVSVAAPAPEPGTWALLLGGFAMIGLSLRSRHSSATARA